MTARKTMLFSPYSGLPRHPSDIESDPEGLLMIDPDSPLYAATPPAPQQPEALAQQEREDAVLAYLDALGDDAIAHIWPDDLVKCQTSECVVEVASVRMGSPDGKTLPLFSRDQVREAIRAARSSEGGGNV